MPNFVIFHVLQQFMHFFCFRLLQMYNELQKSYVKETKINKEQSEAIKNLTVSRICRSWYQTANDKLLGRLKRILTFVK